MFQPLKEQNKITKADFCAISMSLQFVFVGSSREPRVQVQLEDLALEFGVSGFGTMGYWTVGIKAEKRKKGISGRKTTHAMAR
jgi:hypothetical protein